MALGTGNSNGGGVIYNNEGNITTIDGVFNSNTATRGGVIYNYQGTIENIKGSFDGNSSTYGGVIRNNAKNYSESGTESVLTIGDGDSTFSNNTATQGGVVQNSVDGEIKIINGTFSNNKATDNGGVIYNNRKILEVNGIYSENLSDNTAAVIYNSSTGNIETINADFIENIAKAEGSIQNDEGVIGTISGLFKKNITSRGNSGIRNTGTITLVNADFVGNMSGTGEGLKLNTILSNEGTISGITSNLAGNKITIVGSDNILDSNSKTLFTTVESNQDIKFQNITLQNAKDVTNNNKLTFENATIDSKIINETNMNSQNDFDAGVSTDFNQNLNLSRQYKDNSAIWFRPYAVFENIHLKNGPRVDAVSYGSLVGFDTYFIKLKNGWNSVISGYIGYNGAQLHYNGIDTSMSGGVLGVTQTLYKKNFWTALTASTGAFVAETHSMYGKEDTTSIMAGIASKTGYNFEFKEGKFIIQPIWLMSYSMINTFDYTNAAGVRIDSKPIHTIQLNPSLRFIGNVKGWQPYAAVGMVWNIMDKTVAMANSVRLPEMHIKPYVQYGVGVQKTIGEHFTAFGQAMLHNGGRNGIALTGGFRWALDWKKNQTVKNPTNVKTVIKNNVKHSSKKVSKHNDANYEKIADKTIIKQLSKD